LKIIPTLEGGLRIDTEDTADWALLHHIAYDAISCEDSLSNRLGGLVIDPDVEDDWREFVLPDLDQQFSSALVNVTNTIKTAEVDLSEGVGVLWITKEDGMDWFSALNQARLALEEQYQLGNSADIEPEDLAPEERSAFLRSQFYSAIQGLLLEHVMD